MIIACIDLGTNTFHLLIVKISQGSFKEIERIRVYVYLAEQGIETIGSAPYQRALETMGKFSSTLKKYQIKDCRIASTAALRTATNGPALASEIERIIRFPVDIINGQREAALIFKGTQLVYPFRKNETALIIDIGGGSVEFILVKNTRKYWAKSYPIGVAVLKRNFQPNETITEKEIIELAKFLNSTLSDLTKLIQKEKPSALIGASGTFEALQKLLIDHIEPHKTTSHPLVDFEEIYAQLITMNAQERIDFGISPERAELIIVAVVLIKTIIKLGSFEQIIVSPYALKEGLISEMIDDLD